MEIKDKKCKEPKIRCVANANEGVSNHNPWHYSEEGLDTYGLAGPFPMDLQTPKLEIHKEMWLAPLTLNLLGARYLSKHVCFHFDPHSNALQLVLVLSSF